MPTFIKIFLPVPMIVVVSSWKLLHLVNSDWPANKKENEGNSIIPMIVTV